MKKYLSILAVFTIAFYSCQNDDGAMNAETDPSGQPMDTIPTPDPNPGPDPDPDPQPDPSPELGYLPFYTADFDDGTEGQTITDFARVTTPAKTLYSQEVEGPFGGAMVVRQSNTSGNKSFGGNIVDTDLGENEEVWVRWYQYFPEGFCFANGTNGDGGGGAGAIKWMRFQYPGNSARITMELEANAGCAAPCTNCLDKIIPHVVIGEAQGWRERYGNQAYWLEEREFSLGEWHAVQMYMRLSPGSSDKNDGNGLIRIWVDDQLLSEVERNTMPAAGEHLKSIWYGNYWNGGMPNDQHWYFDEIIVTSQEPNTRDAQGNAFIDPTTQVSDFND